MAKGCATPAMPEHSIVRLTLQSQSLGQGVNTNQSTATGCASSATTLRGTERILRGHSPVLNGIVNAIPPKGQSGRRTILTRFVRSPANAGHSNEAVLSTSLRQSLKH